MTLNAQRHAGYEVWYITLTDPATGWGVWLRATTRGTDEAALWTVAMHPDGRKVAAKHAVEPEVVAAVPAQLDAGRWRGEAGDWAWDLSWVPATRGARHVTPLLERSRLAKTTVVLPQPSVEVSGSIRLGENQGTVLSFSRGVHAGQAHLWGSKHARRWAWVHAGFEDGDWLDAVSAVTDRLPRPATPVIARLGGRELAFTGPLQVVRARSLWGLTGWTFETGASRTRLRCEVSVGREQLVGVTYHDPDGERAWCYNSEVATVRAQLWQDGDLVVDRLAERTGHMETGRRDPVPGLPIDIT